MSDEKRDGALPDGFGEPDTIEGVLHQMVADDAEERTELNAYMRKLRAGLPDDVTRCCREAAAALRDLLATSEQIESEDFLRIYGKCLWPWTIGRGEPLDLRPPYLQTRTQWWKYLRPTEKRLLREAERRFELARSAESLGEMRQQLEMCADLLSGELPVRKRRRG